MVQGRSFVSRRDSASVHKAEVTPGPNLTNAVNANAVNAIYGSRFTASYSANLTNAVIRQNENAVDTVLAKEN